MTKNRDTPPKEERRPRGGFKSRESRGDSVRNTRRVVKNERRDGQDKKNE